jgi:hypothetical protein
MTVKLVLLKSGEDVIADVQEMIIGEEEQSQKVIGYFFSRPFRARLIVPDNKSEDEKNNKFNISLIPWMPLSKDKMIPVPNDWVVTIVDPVDELKEMYEEVVVKNEQRKSNQDNSTDEQSDSDQSD